MYSLYNYINFLKACTFKPNVTRSKIRLLLQKCMLEMHLITNSKDQWSAGIQSAFQHPKVTLVQGYKFLLPCE